MEKGERREGEGRVERWEEERRRKGEEVGAEE